MCAPQICVSGFVCVPIFAIGTCVRVSYPPIKHIPPSSIFHRVPNSIHRKPWLPKRVRHPGMLSWESAIEEHHLRYVGWTLIVLKTHPDYIKLRVSHVTYVSHV